MNKNVDNLQESLLNGLKEDSLSDSHYLTNGGDDDDHRASKYWSKNKGKIGVLLEKMFSEVKRDNK